MDLVNALISFAKDFRDLVLRPFILLTVGFIFLTLLLLPGSYLPPRLFNFVEQNGTAIIILTIVLLPVGIIRTLDVYFFPWRKQRKQREKDRESFKRKLDTLSKHELSVLAYCLSQNRITIFVKDRGREPFENAVMSLTTRGFFKQGPSNVIGSNAMGDNMYGHSYDIIDDHWLLLQQFKEDILKRSEASSSQG